MIDKKVYKQIKDKINEIFEPEENDSCEVCKVNFDVIKIQLAEHMYYIVKNATTYIRD